MERVAKEGNLIYFWRVIFTYVIVIFHFNGTLNIIEENGLVQGGYIAVEFFFIVAGFLLYQKCEDYKEKFGNGLGYFIHRYKRIWPEYLFAFFATFISIVIYYGMTFSELLNKLVDSIFEIFMLQGIGLDRGWEYINPTLWFISVLLIASLIISVFLFNYKKNFLRIIAPVIIIISCSLIYRRYGNMNATVEIDSIYLNYPLFRGLMDMSLGVYSAVLSQRIKEKSHRYLLYKIIGSILFVGVIILSMVKGFSNYDFLFVVLIFFGTAFCFLPDNSKFFNCGFIKYLSKISLNMYLIHEVFRSYVFVYITNRDEIVYSMSEKTIWLIVYVVSVTLAAIVMERIFWFGRKYLIKKA